MGQRIHPSTTGVTSDLVIQAIPTGRQKLNRPCIRGLVSALLAAAITVSVLTPTPASASPMTTSTVDPQAIRDQYRDWGIVSTDVSWGNWRPQLVKVTYSLSGRTFHIGEIYPTPVRPAYAMAIDNNDGYTYIADDVNTQPSLMRVPTLEQQRNWTAAHLSLLRPLAWDYKAIAVHLVVYVYIEWLLNNNVPKETDTLSQNLTLFNPNFVGSITWVFQHDLNFQHRMWDLGFVEFARAHGLLLA